MKKRIKIPLIVILIVIVLPILLIGGAIIYFSSSPGENYIREKAVDQLEKTLALDVHIGNLETNVFSSITLEDVWFKHDSVAPGTNLLAFKRLHVEYNLIPLLSKTISVDTVYVDSLAGHVVKVDSSTINLPDFGPPDTTQKEAKPFPFDFRIGGAQVNLSRATYTSETDTLKVGVDSLVAYVEGGKNNRYSYRLTWGNAQLNTKDRRLIVQDFLLGGRVLGDTLRVDTLDLTTPGAQVGGQGTTQYAVTENDTTRDVEAGVSLRGDFAEVSRNVQGLLPDVLTPFSGEFLLTVDVTGTMDTPSADVRFESSRLRAGILYADSLGITGRVSKQEAVVQSLYAGMFGGTIQGSAQVQFDSLMRHQTDLELNGIDLVNLQDTFAPDTAKTGTTATREPIRGQFGGSVTSSGPLSKIWEVDAQANLTARVEEPFDTTAVRPAEYRIKLNYQKHNGQLTFKRGDQTINAKAQIYEDRIRGSFDIHIPQIAQIARPVGVDSLTGDLFGKGTFNGSFSAPIVNATLRSESIDYRRIPVDTLFADIHYDTSEFRINQALIRGEIAQIDTTAPPLGMKGMQGSVRYNVTAQGAVPDDLRGELTLNADAFKFSGIVTDSIRATVLFRDNQIELPMLHVNRDGERINVEGGYDLTKSVGDVEVWFSEFEEVEVEGAGTVQDQRTGKELEEREDRDASEMRLAHLLEGLRQRELGKDRLSFQFDLSDTSALHISGGGRGIQLSDVPPVHPAVQGYAGTAGLQLSFEGTMARPDGELALVIDSLRTDQFSIDTLQVTATLDTAKLTADLRARLQDSDPITAHATLPLAVTDSGIAVDEGARIDVTLSAPQLNLGMASRFLPEGMSINGMGSIDYTARGTLERPSLRGTVQIDSANFSPGPDQPTLEQISAMIVQRDSLIRIENIRANVMEHRLRLAGNINMQDSSTFNGTVNLLVDSLKALRIDGQFGPEGYTAELEIPNLPLEPFEELVPTLLDLKGSLSGHATVEGDSGKPRIDGVLRGKDVKLVFHQIDEPIHKGEFAIQLSSDRLTIDTLNARFGKNGRISAEGFAELRKDGPYFSLTAVGKDLQVDTDDYVVRAPKIDLQFMSETAGEHTLSGDIYVGETTYEKDYRIDTIVRSLNARPTRQIEKPNEFGQSVQLDVRLRDADNINIENNLADLQLAANLRIIGTMAEPIVTGRLNVVEGTVTYLGHQFTIERGVLDFVETDEINPFLNISATTTVIYFSESDQITYNITLLVTGEMDQAQVSWQSDPYLNDSSILALLTFGDPQMGAAGSQAGALAGRLLSSYVGSRVGSAIGLTSVQVQGNLFNPQETGARLSATKMISNRVRLTYITNVSTFNENAIRVSYFLTKNWTLTGTSSQEGEGSLDLKFRIRFR